MRGQSWSIWNFASTSTSFLLRTTNSELSCPAILAIENSWLRCASSRVPFLALSPACGLRRHTVPGMRSGSRALNRMIPSGKWSRSCRCKHVFTVVQRSLTHFDRYFVDVITLTSTFEQLRTTSAGDPLRRLVDHLSRECKNPAIVNALL